MSVQVIFVRHGETQWHAENRYAGVSDVALTNRGRAQGRALADWAAKAGLDAVWASPLTRSRETASESAQRAGVPVQVDQRLREIDFGVGEGLTRAEMEDQFPADLAAFQSDPVEHHFPKGEHPTETVERYLTFLADLETDHPDSRVLVVGHSTAIRLTLCRLLGVPLREYRRVFPFLANCALNEIILRDGAISLLALNLPVTSGEPR